MEDLRKYSNRRYSSADTGDFIVVETWERHRLWGIKYQSFDKYFSTPLASARSSAYLTESVSLPIPVYLVVDFLHICLFTTVLDWVVFFRAKQPLIIVAWRARASLKPVSLKSSSLNRGHHLSLQVPLALRYKKSGLNRAWRRATRTILIRLRYWPNSISSL